MNLQQLQEAGGFVSAELVKKEVEWTHTDKQSGESITDKFDVYVKRQSFGVVQETFTGNSDREKSASYIANSLRFGEDGCEAMSYKQAYQLDPALAFKFVAVIAEVNKTNEGPPKNSVPPTSSGMNSSSTELAAEQ